MIPCPSKPSSRALSILSAMLLAFNGMNLNRWAERALRFLVEVQGAALACRTGVLEVSDDIGRDVDELLESASQGNLVSRYASASTVHTSAVDDTGLACSVTASSGYGSGEMPAGTGICCADTGANADTDRG